MWFFPLHHLNCTEPIICSFLLVGEVANERVWRSEGPSVLQMAVFYGLLENLGVTFSVSDDGRTVRFFEKISDPVRTLLKNFKFEAIGKSLFGLFAG